MNSGQSKRKSTLRKVLYFLRQIGLDPVRTLSAFRGTHRFVIDLYKFFRLSPNKKELKLSPVLLDFKANAGSSDGHYFWQDLITAQWIYSMKSDSHLDVGSRIDGFIAHLLTFRAVTLLDIRPASINIPNLSIVIGDAQQNLKQKIGMFNSVSSLHSLEHFGLGRYGDPIDPSGHQKGLRSIAECVEEGGSLFVSFPIGIPQTQFNEQRILDPLWPLKELPEFRLYKFVLIPWKGAPRENLLPSDVDISIVGQAGLYWFKKI